MPHNATLRWILIAFALCGLLIATLVVWQLAETTPARWCVIAKAGSPDEGASCLAILLKLLEIKQWAVLALLTILGLTVLSVVVVALGVKINANGPGGFAVDVSADQTTVSSGDNIAVIPTPPAGDQNA